MKQTKDQITVTISRSAAEEICEHLRNAHDLSGGMELVELPHISVLIEGLKALHAIQSELMGLGDEI